MDDTTTDPALFARLPFYNPGKDFGPVGVENVQSRVAGHVLISTIEDLTEPVLTEALELHRQGKCTHTIIQDEKGYLYDARHCCICNAGLGLI